MRRGLSRGYWLLGLAGNVHWAIYAGAGLLLAAFSTTWASLQQMPRPLLAVVFIGMFLIGIGAVNHIQNWRVARHNRIDPEDQRREQDALDRYFAQMEQWLRGPDAPLRQDDSVRVSAQERTIGILPGLSPDGKRRVVRFLHRHELIKVGTARISLAHADLSSANLSGLGLQDSLLTGANLRDANLS